MQIKQTSPQGITLLKTFEGFRAKPYRCPAGIPTIGFGATFYEDGHAVNMQDPPISEQQATDLLAYQLKGFEKAVSQQIPETLNQLQFDALVLFCFNIGITAFKKSTLLKKVKADPNNPAIRDEFMKWVYAAGKKSKGLLNRRTHEAELYFS